MQKCENCHDANATVTVTGADGKAIYLCDDCAKSLQGAMVQKVE